MHRQNIIAAVMLIVIGVAVVAINISSSWMKRAGLRTRATA